MRSSAARKPHSLLGTRPASLHGVLVDFDWDNRKLWALDLPVERVEVARLRWLLRLPMWSFEGVPFAVSPEQVRGDPRRYRARYARTLAADLAFPMHVFERPGGVLSILDGVHRLLKADLSDHTVVSVKKVQTERFDEIASD